jgi:hypothetical protein
MAFAALFAVYGLRISKDYYARFIILLIIMSVGLTFLPYPGVKSIGLVVYEVCLVLTIVYALLKSGLSNKKRTLLLLAALPVFLAISCTASRPSPWYPY